MKHPTIVTTRKRDKLIVTREMRDRRKNRAGEHPEMYYLKFIGEVQVRYHGDKIFFSDISADSSFAYESHGVNAAEMVYNCADFICGHEDKCRIEIVSTRKCDRRANNKTPHRIG